MPNVLERVDHPKVSIGMPVFNEEEYLSRALDDLLAQTFVDFELIISDNCSTDRTQEICELYASQDQRIQYYRQPSNFGAKRNFMFVLNKAQGEFFMWAAGDDRWDKDFIYFLFRALTNTEHVSAFCPFVFFDEKDQILTSPIFEEYSNPIRLFRIIKYTLTYRDCFIMGLHRKDIIINIKMPIWWWVNSKTPLNSAFPMCIYLLARGDCAFVDMPPLLFKRVHTEMRHAEPFSDRQVLRALAFFLRKINVFYESLLATYHGSGSIPFMVVSSPFLGARCLKDCLNMAFELLLQKLGSAPLKLYGGPKES